jgi:hypothetical protein
MKQILVIALMIVGFSLQAQEMTLKEYTDETYKWVYQYDNQEDWNLETIIKYEGDIVVDVYTYRNDTLVRTGIDSTNIYDYVYSEDVVDVYYTHGDPDIGKYHKNSYHINEDNEVFLSYTMDFTGDTTTTEIYGWVFDNLIIHEIGDTMLSYAYYSAYKNPLLNENKYCKLGFISSLNYIYEDNDYTYLLISSINDYPKEVEVYNDDDYSHTLTYKYHNTVDIIESYLEPHTTLSVHYFDLMGREIPKPTKGIYIERKVTDKGIISTKHFIQ